MREKLPDTRRGFTHKVEIFDSLAGTMSFYIIIGVYPDDRPGEVFLRLGKEGSTMRGMLDIVGIQTSMLLQSGTSLENIVKKLKGQSFSPAGATDNPDIPICTSLLDYLGNWLEFCFSPTVAS